MRAPTDFVSFPVVAPVSSTRSFTRHFPVITRVLLGLMFAVFGLKRFLNFIPAPTTPPEGAMAFHAFLAPTGLGMTVLVVGLQLYLVWNHRSIYRPMLTARAKTG